VPKLRRLAAPVVVAALALAAPAGASAAGTCADTDLMPAADNMPRVAASTLCLLNEERAAHGLPAVAQNPSLDRASVAYSQRLVRESFFAHEAPDGSDVVDRLTAVGYIRDDVAWTVGENLAWAQGVLATPANVMRAWMESPGHRENILGRDFREIGVGIVMGTPSPGPEGATFTTEFGRRSSGLSASAASAGVTTPTAKRPAAHRRAAKRRAAARRARAARAARIARSARATTHKRRAKARSARAR